MVNCRKCPCLKFESTDTNEAYYCGITEDNIEDSHIVKYCPLLQIELKDGTILKPEYLDTFMAIK